MKKKTFIFITIFSFCLFLRTGISGFSQNIGIGTTNSKTNLHTSGSLMVTEPNIHTNSSPTPAKTKTMVNNTSTNFLFSDSTGRLYDPGGSGGNYISNLQADAFVNITVGIIGYEFIIESSEFWETL